MKKPWWKRPLLDLFLLALLLALPGLYSGLKLRRYQLNESALNGHLRIAFITDLHNSRYGRDMKKLLDALEEAEPSLILLGGDLFEDDSIGRNTLAFLNGLPQDIPCYYVTGNHECRSDPSLFIEEMKLLESFGIIRLEGSPLTLEINGVCFNLCGVDDPKAHDQPAVAGSNSYSGFYGQLRSSAKVLENGLYTILLAHRPEQIDVYASFGFDLVLAGHAHGGQWRIPGLLNGIYAPDQGFFPEYTGGIYQSGDTSMLVSRGLARRRYVIPRFYNRPELVILDFN